MPFGSWKKCWPYVVDEVQLLSQQITKFLQYPLSIRPSAARFCNQRSYLLIYPLMVPRFMLVFFSSLIVIKLVFYVL